MSGLMKAHSWSGSYAGAIAFALLPVTVVWCNSVVVAMSGATQNAVSQEAKGNTEARPEILGVVVEPGTRRPIAGVTVTLYKMPALEVLRSFGRGTQFEVLAVDSTDASGNFRLRPEEFGTFRIEVKKEGWGPAGSPLKGLATSDTVRVSKERPVREVKFWMTQPGTLTGTALDAETGEPIGGRLVLAWQTVYQEGRRNQGLPVGMTKTLPSGEFSFPKLPPGDYLIQITPLVLGQKRVLQRFSENDLQQVDKDYEAAYWPGRRDLETAFPVALGSGGFLGLGRLAANITPRYRVHVSLQAGDCGPDEHAQIGVRSSLSSILELLGEVSCNKELLITGFEPGGYQLAASVERPGGGVYGSAPFLIKDKNVDVTVPLMAGPDLDVRVLAAEGSAKTDFKRIRLRLRPLNGAKTAGTTFGPPDAEGRLRIPSMEMTEHEFSIWGLGNGYYTKEVRYNGSTLSTNVFGLNGGAISHSLEVVVDDKPAALTGEVRSGEHTVTRPYVVLSKWPVDGDVYRAIHRTTGDADGRFQFTGLPPGEYRIFAVEPENKDKLEERSIMEGLLASAKKTTLTVSGFQNVTVAPADPGR